MSKTIEISIGEYKRLCNKERLLDCLRSAGVDNWSGYDDALDDYHDHEDDDVDD